MIKNLPTLLNLTPEKAFFYRGVLTAWRFRIHPALTLAVDFGMYSHASHAASFSPYEYKYSAGDKFEDWLRINKSGDHPNERLLLDEAINAEISIHDRHGRTAILDAGWSSGWAATAVILETVNLYKKFPFGGKWHDIRLDVANMVDMWEREYGETWQYTFDPARRSLR